MTKTLSFIRTAALLGLLAACVVPFLYAQTEPQVGYAAIRSTAHAIGRAYQATWQNKIGIIGTEIYGVTVGMSPRRVLLEYQQRSWALTSLNPITLEDMIEDKIGKAHFYISTHRDGEADLEIAFYDNRVAVIRKTYSVSDGELEAEVSKARTHLSRLGNLKETAEEDSIRLIYQPYKDGYVLYDFHKLVKNQKGFRVWLVVADY